MSRSLRAAVRAVSLAAAAVFASAAQAALIDFESIALDTSVSNQFAGLGVVFSSPGNPTQPEVNTFSGNSTTGHVLADFSIVGGIQLDATFAAGVTSVSALAYANPSYTVTMNAYDAADALIGTVTSGGGAYNQGTLSLNGIGTIYRVSWLTGSDVAAVGIDDLAFAPAVPEPETYAMLALGLIVLPWAVRRRRAQRRDA
jgi:hypothetical protein